MGADDCQSSTLDAMLLTIDFTMFWQGESVVPKYQKRRIFLQGTKPADQ